MDLVTSRTDDDEEEVEEFVQELNEYAEKLIREEDDNIDEGDGELTTQDNNADEVKFRICFICDIILRF